MDMVEDELLALLNGATDIGDQPGHNTWHKGNCGVCDSRKPITEPRDFEYLHPAWRDNA